MQINLAPTIVRELIVEVDVPEGANVGGALDVSFTQILVDAVRILNKLERLTVDIRPHGILID